MLYATLISAVIATSALAADTVWVETTYQKDARLECEHKLSELSNTAENLRNAIGIVHRVGCVNYHQTGLGQIVNGIEEKEIFITESDKKCYVALLQERLGKLKPLYQQIRKQLALCEADVKSGPFYIRSSSLTEAVNELTPLQLASLHEQQNASPEWQYYPWEDWVRLVLSGKLRG